MRFPHDRMRVGVGEEVQDESADKSVEGVVRAVDSGAAVGFFDPRARPKAGQAFLGEPHHHLADVPTDIDRVRRKPGFEQFLGEAAGPAAELQDRPAGLEVEMRRKVIQRRRLIESLKSSFFPNLS